MGRLHMRSVAMETGMAECGECSKIFSCPSHYRRHLDTKQHKLRVKHHNKYFLQCENDDAGEAATRSNEVNEEFLIIMLVNVLF